MEQVDKTGQAGISDADYAAIFGITPQMIAAGYEAFCCEISGAEPLDVARDVVIQVYRAMRELEMPVP